MSKMANLNKLIGELHSAIDSGIDLKLPDLVILCPICKGHGKYEQRYTAGCGGGSYRSPGPCEYCKHDMLFMKGSGFKYKKSKINEKSVPESVLYQIYEMNKATIKVMDQLRESK